MLFQLVIKHNGINIVVSNKKKIEIPSTPKIKCKFNSGNQLNFVTNWKDPKDLLKKNQTNRDPKNDEKVTFKATNFNKFSSLDGMNNKIKIPKIGINKIYANKLFKFNMFLHFIGFEPMTISLENCCSIQLS